MLEIQAHEKEIFDYKLIGKYYLKEALLVCLNLKHRNVLAKY